MDAKLIMTVEEMKNHENWLKMRTAGIGGSDAGTIMGMNPYKSPYQLWLEKTGQVEPEDISGKESVYWGTILESPVADEFARRTEKRVKRSGMMQSIHDPWMLANVDRLVIGERAGLECKTTNAFSVKDWDDDQLPDTYYWQCQHYMMTTGLSVWYIAVLIGGQNFQYKAIPRCDSDINALYDAERIFWDVNVKGGVMPDIDGSTATENALKERYPGGKDDPVELSSKAAELLDMYLNFKAQVKEAKAKQDEMQNKICAMMGNFEIAIIGDKTVKWTPTTGRTTLDSKKLKADHPDIFKQYSKAGKPNRRFTV
jgi:putative phage-type endonuclease